MFRLALIRRSKSRKLDIKLLLDLDTCAGLELVFVFAKFLGEPYADVGEKIAITIKVNQIFLDFIILKIRYLKKNY
jgi:hypothetical protein